MYQSRIEQFKSENKGALARNVYLPGWEQGNQGKGKKERGRVCERLITKKDALTGRLHKGRG
jgi:hypothetical protein